MCRDTAHSERVRALESLMAEKEKQLVEGASVLRQQLAVGRREREAVERRLAEREGRRTGGGEREGGRTGGGDWQAECDSLRLVLDLR